MSRAGIGYQTVYYWTCPKCGAIYAVRRRPRAGKALRCQSGPEQQRVNDWGGCGRSFTSSGQREGIAPT